MKKIILPLAVAFAMTATSCKDNSKTDETTVETSTEMTENSGSEQETKDSEELKSLTIALNSKSGSDVSGEVVFTEDENHDVQMVANLKGLTPGIHAIHIHETADCSSDDGKSSGGHWNPTGQPHGKWGTLDGKFHKGDIGNFVANEDGEGTVNFHTELWCIGCDDDTKNIMGKAVIVHQGEDDLTSQPSGAAGKRVSCAGIIE